MVYHTKSTTLVEEHVLMIAYKDRDANIEQQRQKLRDRKTRPLHGEKIRYNEIKCYVQGVSS